MHLQPIKEFLSYIEECHISLSHLYNRLSMEASDDHIKSLLDFMSHKEKSSYQQLRTYAQQAPADILETQLSRIADQSFIAKCQETTIKSNSLVEDVTTLAVNFNIQIIELLQTAAHSSPTIEAEIALEKLSNQEEETLHHVIDAGRELEFI